MAANIITLVRVFLSFFTIWMFQGGFSWRIAAVLMTLLVIYLDSLDGIVARRNGAGSKLGALFDIAGDRIVEHVYWIFFSVTELISVWIPIIIVSRSFVVDTLRAAAFSAGRTPFGKDGMMRSALASALTASRYSRAIYGGAKVIAFCALGLLLALQENPPALEKFISAGFQEQFFMAANLLSWLAVSMNLIRGFPVLWEGRRYIISVSGQDR